jgi:hypothetical protein
MIEGNHRRTITPSPLGQYAKRSKREWITRARQRFLDQPLEERIPGDTLVFAQPTPRTSKGERNAKIRAYKNEKRIKQAQQL